MPIKHLEHRHRVWWAKILGNVPKNLAVRWSVLGVLLLFVLFSIACKDSPGYTTEELQSDPLPEFNDSAIGGQWLTEGGLTVFDVKEHGVYVFHEVKRSGEGDEDDGEEAINFKLKRVGGLLFLEYFEEKNGVRYYRPCWIGIDENALELHCLEEDQLREFGVSFEKRKMDDSEFDVITDTQEHLRQVYLEQANNSRVFELTMRLTRPQPARVARARRKALAGSAEAQEQLARYLSAGEIVERDIDQALEWARKSAEAGRPSGQVLYGSLLEQKARFSPQADAPPLLDEAKVWYQRAAEKEVPEAFSRLGHLFETAAPINEHAALESYRKGAELGDPESHVQLGLRYAAGNGLPQDQREAIRHLEQVSEGYRQGPVWKVMAEIYLHSFDPELRNKKSALHAGEMAIRQWGDPDSYALAAEAAYENGLYGLAEKYELQSICEGCETENARRAALQMYRSLALAQQVN